MPPDHSTASKRHVADGADERQYGDDRTDEHVLDRIDRARRVPDEQALEEVVPELGDEAREQEADRDLAVEHLPVPAEVVRDVGPCRDARQALAPAHLAAGAVMLVAGVGADRVRAGLLLELRAHEQPQQRRHQHDHHDPADVLGDGELPPDQHPDYEPELPDEVRRGELERERGRG
jgi:hypothetical protein